MKNSAKINFTSFTARLEVEMLLKKDYGGRFISPERGSASPPIVITFPQIFLKASTAGVRSGAFPSKSAGYELASGFP